MSGVFGAASPTRGGSGVLADPPRQVRPPALPVPALTQQPLLLTRPLLAQPTRQP